MEWRYQTCFVRRYKWCALWPCSPADLRSISRFVLPPASSGCSPCCVFVNGGRKKWHARGWESENAQPWYVLQLPKARFTVVSVTHSWLGFNPLWTQVVPCSFSLILASIENLDGEEFPKTGSFDVCGWFGKQAGVLTRLFSFLSKGDLLPVMCERAGFPQESNLILYEVWIVSFFSNKT